MCKCYCTHWCVGWSLVHPFSRYLGSIFVTQFSVDYLRRTCYCAAWGWAYHKRVLVCQSVSSSSMYGPIGTAIDLNSACNLFRVAMLCFLLLLSAVSFWATCPSFLLRYNLITIRLRVNFFVDIEQFPSSVCFLVGFFSPTLIYCWIVVSQNFSCPDNTWSRT